MNTNLRGSLFVNALILFAAALPNIESLKNHRKQTVKATQRDMI